MNFFVDSSSSARRTMRPYLEMFRMDPQQVGQAFSSSFKNGGAGFRPERVPSRDIL